jgi:hypothetical protein
MKAPQILIYIGSALAISVTITWALLTTHVQRPHEGAATQSEVRELHQDLKQDIRELRTLIIEGR